MTVATGPAGRRSSLPRRDPQRGTECAEKQGSPLPMLDAPAKPPVTFPDDPMKWDGWSTYRAENPYERLCLDAKSQPTDDKIEEHCTVLLRWWQKKLPLKSQPSNPMAQLLGRGIDDAPKFLVQARVQLLDPARRRQVDEELTAQAKEETLAEFSNFVAFSVAGKVLTADAEAILVDFGQSHGLSEEQARGCIDEQLKKKNARRAAPAPLAPEAVRRPRTKGESEMEFHRILGLSSLDLAEATRQVREIFIRIAENLGIELERAEDLLDAFLDLQSCGGTGAPAQPSAARAKPAPIIKRIPAAAATSTAPQRIPFPLPNAAPQPPSGPAVRPVQPVAAVASASMSPPVVTNALGAPMMLIPAGEFIMGSDAEDAAPNEQPLTPVTMSEFYMSRYLITNAQYELFDSSHRRKRLPGAADDHPVVHVTSFEAVKFCHWLSQRDGKTYRLPTEAEWEYAARGSDGRKYPWGNAERRGDLANFADASTTFAWRDPLIHDGYPETSPLGAFPRGISPFGIEDMAGNVWEWCLDFFQPLAGTPKRNPRGLVSGAMRIYRGGSWKSRFSNLRATVRSSNAPNYASNDVGFRIMSSCGAGEPSGSDDSAA